MLFTITKLIFSSYWRLKTKSVFDRTIQELQSQLQYERLRREKLESQLDECRAEVDQLRETMQDTQVPNFMAVVSVLFNTLIFLKK